MTSGNRRASMTMKAIVSSATASAFLPGVVTTGMPRAVAAATSTLTGPPRAQQTRRSAGAASRTAALTGAPWTTRTSWSSSAAMTWAGLPMYSLSPSSDGVPGTKPGSSVTSANVTAWSSARPSNAAWNADDGQ